MKIRNGFVSNSSSSSFIVTLPKSIQEYTLEEFRELISEELRFDPVKRLYDDLCNTDESQYEFDRWDRERYGMDELGNSQYIVQYGNDIGGNYYINDYMENEFMPDLANDDESEIDIISYNNH